MTISSSLERVQVGTTSFRHLLIIITLIADAISVEDFNEVSDVADVIVLKPRARNAEGKRGKRRKSPRTLVRLRRAAREGGQSTPQPTKLGDLPEWNKTEGPANESIYLQNYRALHKTN